jgi:hypothetical protein
MKAKLEQDRTAMLLSYAKMCKTFKVPRRERVSSAQFAAMSNLQVLRLCRDLYNRAPVKLAKKLEAQVLRHESGESELMAWLKNIRVQAYYTIVGFRKRRAHD